MSFEKYIELCGTFHDDPATRSSMRDVVIPRIKRRANEYRSIRLSLTEPDHKALWRESGLVDEEARLRHAVIVANHRLATLAAQRKGVSQ